MAGFGGSDSEKAFEVQRTLVAAWSRALGVEHRIEGADISDFHHEVTVEGARWAPDPTERYVQRYWDGEEWTKWVAGVIGGQRFTDPIRSGQSFGPPPLEASREHPFE
jgi:hypothetical protein